MDSQREQFVESMNRFIAEGGDFSSVVKSTLADSLGHTPSDVLLRWLKRPALQNPAILYAELPKYFGAGSESIFRLIVDKAKEVLAPAPETIPAKESVESIAEVVRRIEASKETQGPNFAAPQPPSWRAIERFDPEDPVQNQVEGRLLVSTVVGNFISFKAGQGFLVDAEIWREMRNMLLGRQEGIWTVTGMWGQYGRTLGIKTRNMFGNGTDLTMDALTGLVKDSGLGTITLDGDLVHGTHLSVTVHDCVFCSGYLQHKPLQCWEFVGLLGGYLSEVFGPRTVTEERCLNSGDHFCRFTAEQA